MTIRTWQIDFCEAGVMCWWALVLKHGIDPVRAGKEVWGV